MRILAIDTALGACAACVAQGGDEAPGADGLAGDAPGGGAAASGDAGGRPDPMSGAPVLVLAEEALAMERGHAEALLPLLERVVSRTEGGFERIERVAVTVGPGSYTGLRVGLSAARALGLALGVPVVGVTTLSAHLAPLLAAGVRGGIGVIAAAIDARHGAVYVQAIAANGGLVVAPAHLPVADAVRRLGSGRLLLAGSGAPALAAAAGAAGVHAEVRGSPAAPPIAWVAALGAVADPEQAVARPLYLRAPDAAPQDHHRLPRR